MWKLCSQLLFPEWAYVAEFILINIGNLLRVLFAIEQIQAN